MNLFNALLAYIRPLETAVPARRNPTTAEIRRAGERYSYVRASIGYHQGHLDSLGKRVASECYGEVVKETPYMVFYHWVRVREAGEEAILYTPEVQRVLIGLWERWSDREAVEKEFGFLMLDGRWHGGLPDEALHHLPTQPVLEGFRMWLAKRGCSKE